MSRVPTSPCSSYGHRMLGRLRGMMERQMYCDVEIVVQGRSILCHRAVLAAASEYFGNMFRHSFKENSEQMSRIDLDSNPQSQQVDSKVVTAVVNFIYTGHMSPSCDSDLLPDIFCLAHQWLLDDLLDICTKLMSEQVSASNVFSLLHFAKQYDNNHLDICAKKFLATNLPILLSMPQFKETDEEVILDVISDPIVFCHDDRVWLKAAKVWAKECDHKLKKLFAAAPLHLLAEEERRRIIRDEELSKEVVKHIREVTEDTEMTRSVVQYVPADMFSLNEEPGWLMHTMRDKIVIERMEQFAKTADHHHLSRGGVERAMQAFHGSTCYMFFESECPASNNRYLGDDHQHDLCSKVVKHLWGYDVIKKVWTKKEISLRATDQFDFDCLVCDFQVWLHLQDSSLFLFLVGKEREILARTELEGGDSSWSLVTSSAVVDREDSHIQPRLYTSTIIKVTQNQVWFHGKADWDAEAKCGIYTMDFNHCVTFKIVIDPSLEIVIADFYKDREDQMLILTDRKRPKPRMFEAAAHNYCVTVYDLSSDSPSQLSSVTFDLLAVKGVFFSHHQLHLVCAKDCGQGMWTKDSGQSRPRQEQETVSRTLDVESGVWCERTVTSLTDRSVVFFKDSEMGSRTFRVPYHLMYRKQYLAQWSTSGDMAGDSDSVEELSEPEESDNSDSDL